MRSTVVPSVPRTAIALLVSACFAPIPLALAEEQAAMGSGFSTGLGFSTASGFSTGRGLTLAAAEIRLASSRSAPRRAFTVRTLRDRGVTVAAIDTGANVNHVDLAGRIAAGGYSVISGDGDVADSNGHGTLIASIIAARRDPDSRGRDPRVLPIKVFSGPTTTEALVNAGLAYSIGRAPIVNLSLAATGPVAETGMRDSVAAGQLLVVAAGNRGNVNPDWPARFASQAWANNQIIAVGAVDSSNVIASFSNRAGDTRDVFLVAPGVGVTGASAFSNSGLAVGSGTSVAAPYIAGVAALVKSYWPQLSARQVADVLFVTATDLGAPGTDDVYGRGLVNISAALTPVGAVSVPLAGGRAVLLSNIGYNPGPIAGAAVRAAALDGRLGGIALDSFGRQFGYDLGAGLSRAANLTLDRVLGAADRHFGYADSVLANGSRLVYATDTLAMPTVGSLAAYEQRDRASDALGGLALTLPLAGGRELAAGTLGLANTYFGFAGMVDHGAALAIPALANPLFALAPAHHHLGFGQTLADGFKLKAGFLSTGGTSLLLTQYGLLEKPATQANALVIEASKRIGSSFLSITGTQLTETASYLGSYSAEAFALGRRPATTALTLSAAYSFSPTWVLAGQFTTATTPGYSNETASLISGVQASRASGFGVALVKTATWTQRDRLSFSVSQPLRAQSGAINFDLPVDVDASGNVLRATESVSLKPSGRERISELHYALPVSKEATLGLAAIHRVQPNHEAAAPTERVVALRFSARF